MINEFFDEHWTDENGNPAGGTSWGKGFTISWQNGSLGSGKDRKEPNGAFIETILNAVRKRIEFYQNGKFNCEENEEAIYHIQKALEVLNSRTKRRVSDGTEGTHQGN